MIYVLLKGGKRRKDGEVWTTPKGRRMTKKNGKVIPVASGKKARKQKKPEKRVLIPSARQYSDSVRSKEFKDNYKYLSHDQVMKLPPAVRLHELILTRGQRFYMKRDLYNKYFLPSRSGKLRNRPLDDKPEAVAEHRYMSTKPHNDTRNVHDILSAFTGDGMRYSKTSFQPTSMVNHDKYGMTATDGVMLMHVPHKIPEEHHGLKYPKGWKGERDDQYHTSDVRFPPVAKIIPPMHEMNGRNIEDVKDLYNGAEMAYRDWKHAPKADRTNNPIFRLVTTGNTTIPVDARRVMKIASAFQKLGHRELHLQAYRDSDTGSQRPVVFGPTRTVVDDNPLGKVPFALLMPIKEK